MFITADQLLCHAIGDFCLQSHWMATEKTKRSVAALAHVSTYVLPFLFLTRDWRALAFIVSTHFVVDRWRLARYVVWAKNFLAPPVHESVGVVEDDGGFWRSENFAWGRCTKTGYGPDVPDWLAVWLLIVADNIIHVTLNGLALYWWDA